MIRQVLKSVSLVFVLTASAFAAPRFSIRGSTATGSSSVTLTTSTVGPFVGGTTFYIQNTLTPTTTTQMFSISSGTVSDYFRVGNSTDTNFTVQGGTVSINFDGSGTNGPAVMVVDNTNNGRLQLYASGPHSQNLVFYPRYSNGYPQIGTTSDRIVFLSGSHSCEWIGSNVVNPSFGEFNFRSAGSFAFQPVSVTTYTVIMHNTGTQFRAQTTANIPVQIYDWVDRTAPSLQVYRYSSTGDPRETFGFTPTWADSTDATRKASVSLNIWDTNTRSFMQADTNGSAPYTQFFGSTTFTSTIAVRGAVYAGGYGTSGQVLTSNGSNAAPSWTTVSGGGGGTTIWGQDHEVVVSNTVSTITSNGVLASSVTASGKYAFYLNFDKGPFADVGGTFSAKASSITLLGPTIELGTETTGIYVASVTGNGSITITGTNNTPSAAPIIKVNPSSVTTSGPINIYTSSLTAGGSMSITGTNNILGGAPILNVNSSSVTTSGQIPIYIASDTAGASMKITGTNNVLRGAPIFNVDCASVTCQGAIVSSMVATGVVPNTYTLATVTVDGQGRITSASNGSGGSGDMILASTQTSSGAKTFQSSTTISGPLLDRSNGSGNLGQVLASSGPGLGVYWTTAGGGSGDMILASTQTNSGQKTWNAPSVFNGSVTVNNISGFTLNNSTFVVSVATNIILQDQGNNFIVMPSTFIYLSTDTTIASTSLSNITGMQFQIAADEVWRFETDFLVVGTTSGGTNFGFNGPVGSTVTATVFGDTSAVGTFSAASITALNTADSVAFNTAAAAIYVCVKGTIVANANGGTCSLMWKSVTAGVVSRIRGGSAMTATRIR